MERAPDLADRLTVVEADALRVPAAQLGEPPTALVANLPYNVAVPVLLHLLAELPSLRTALVMVQAEVADRLAAPPGSRTYGVPSVKAGFFGTVRRAGSVGRAVFWPVPQVESGLVRIDRYAEPPWPMRRVDPVARCSRSSTPRSRNAARPCARRWPAGPGRPAKAQKRLEAAGIDPSARGETLDTAAFVRLAATA